MNIEYLRKQQEEQIIGMPSPIMKKPVGFEHFSNFDELQPLTIEVTEPIRIEASIQALNSIHFFNAGLLVSVLGKQRHQKEFGVQTIAEDEDKITESTCISTTEIGMMTDKNIGVDITFQVNLFDEILEKLKTTKEKKISELKLKISEYEKEIEGLHIKVKCIEERFNKAKQEEEISTHRDAINVSAQFKACRDELLLKDRDLKSEKKKSLELFKQVGQLKEEKKSLEEEVERFRKNAAESKEKLKSSKRSTSRSLSHSIYYNQDRQEKRNSEKLNSSQSRVKRRLDSDELEKQFPITAETKDELSLLITEYVNIKKETQSLSLKFDELKHEKFILFAKYKELDECLRSQVSRNRTLSQENSFLRESLLHIKPSDSVRGSLELELLSSEETKDLVQAILSKAIKSQSLFHHVINSDEFGLIIQKYEEIYMQNARQHVF